MNKKLSHVDSSGKASMVDVGQKSIQKRTAWAEGKIYLKPETLSLIAENAIKKGDVLTVAQIAGIQAAKQTSALIPLCHPLLLTQIEVNMKVDKDGVQANTMVECNGQTGVEMEALVAVNIALLTIYDMCKAVDKEMEIGKVRLVKKIKEDI